MPGPPGLIRLTSGREKVVAPFAFARVRLTKLCFDSRRGTVLVRTVAGLRQFRDLRRSMWVVDRFRSVKEKATISFWEKQCGSE